MQSAAPKSSVRKRCLSASPPPDAETGGTAWDSHTSPRSHARCKDHSPALEVYSSDGQTNSSAANAL